MNPIREFLTDHCTTAAANFFYQKELNRAALFEKDYLELREKEHRIYPDAVVEHLPEISSDHPLANEWALRKTSVQRLVKIVRTREPRAILEIGCGNGWLSHQLAIQLNASVCGLDVNEMELLQAARVFRRFENLSFLYADIFSMTLKKDLFDSIILASSIQYFPSVEAVLRRLFEFLAKDGVIYIMDSPFYKSAKEITEAKARSLEHFTRLGSPSMAKNYHHHHFKTFDEFNVKVEFDPRTFSNRMKRRLLNVLVPPFPIIAVTRHQS